MSAMNPNLNIFMLDIVIQGVMLSNYFCFFVNVYNLT